MNLMNGRLGITHASANLLLNLASFRKAISFKKAISLNKTEQKVNNFVISNEVKFVIFVPESHADKVREIIGKCKGGIIGDYSYCSFTTKGTGRYQKMINGEIGSYDTVVAAKEEKIETVIPRELVSDLLKKIKKVHPHEELGYDIYPLYCRLKSKL